jgi:hypothetical protein
MFTTRNTTANASLRTPNTHVPGAAARAIVPGIVAVILAAACSAARDGNSVAPTSPLANVVAVSTKTVDAAIVGTAYNVALGATGGDGDYTWTIASGSLPPGLALSAAGALYGTPTAAAIDTVTVSVASGTQTATQLLVVMVHWPQLSISTTTLAGGIVGTAYGQTLQAAGGTGSYVWSVLGGSTPPGLTLSSGGELTGTPTAVATTGFTVQVTSGNATATQNLAVTVTAWPPLSITSSARIGAVVGSLCTQTLHAVGGTGSYTWTIVSGALPAGISLSSAGTLGGMPQDAGTSLATVQVTSGGLTATMSLSITVSVNIIPVFIDTTSLGFGIVGATYWQPLRATGGLSTYSWAIVQGTTPAGLTLTADGILSGVPTTVGSGGFTVQVTSGSATSQATFSWLVIPTPPLVITTTALAGGQRKTAYSYTLQAAGGIGTYSWSVVAGPPPPGLTLSSAGVLSGTLPPGPGNYKFTAQVTSGAQTAVRQFVLPVTK